ncbi:MAG: serine--tRNA ligase [Alphaproteobacteria bacterium]|mgnify:CR=1 FL=1|jgi:seryl-tRNA synthetase|nr:serine--tRNA ligase [Alphaproteobacteria bacterium]MBT5389354.1 serine--tRNA ligase [Alphaproteobacteria bacterium]MBT5541028.1 serine--tRNA ligase [Alphaproteobacteria bacterium]
MFDLKWIRENKALFDAGLKRRGHVPVGSKLLELDEQHRSLITSIQDIQQERNENARKLGMAKSKGENIESLVKEGALLKKKFPELEAKEGKLSQEIKTLLAGLPNLPDESTPDGKDESENVEIRKWGEIPTFDFKPKEHVEIGEELGLMDFEKASQMSGSRFVVLKGALAQLERALVSFMLDLHTQNFDYEEVSVPFLVRDNAVFGTGQLPKFSEDLFQTTDGRWLIPTGEVPLTNLVAGDILDEEDLPKRFVAYSYCFRSEAGAAGKDTRGMVRQHQFSKVELVSITHPDTSGNEHERMTKSAEEVLKRLALPYRVVSLCTGDLGVAARKTYDIEVWLPGQNTYREISSCSVCGDYQARRMKARFRPISLGEKKEKPQFVHTLNGSGIPIGRTLVAILENYQQEDGSVIIPEILHSYMNGLTEIHPHERD